MAIKQELKELLTHITEKHQDQKTKLDNYLNDHGYSGTFTKQYIETLKTLEYLLILWGAVDLDLLLERIETLEEGELLKRLQSQHVNKVDGYYEEDYQKTAFIIYNKQFLSLTNDQYSLLLDPKDML